jgi:hypothetical protein
MMPTNEELEDLYNTEQLRDNILQKKNKITEYQKGIDVLRSSDKPLDPFVQGRILLLESLIQDYQEAISTWETLLHSLAEESEWNASKGLTKTHLRGIHVRPSQRS